MRPRHWQALKTATKKDFTPPYEDANLLLGGILELHLHEFANDVGATSTLYDAQFNHVLSIYYRWRRFVTRR